MTNPIYWLLPKKYRKILVSFFNTFTCNQTGFLFQQVGNYRVFLRNISEYLSVSSLDKLCKNFYYKFYLPNPQDTVVCIGAGLGHEAIWLHNLSQGARYIGVEIQPYVYELLCNTFKQSNNLSAFGRAIDNTQQTYYLNSPANYTAVASETSGNIEVDSIRWMDFLLKYKIEHIDLLQINIEGAEKYLLPMIKDYTNIKRIIVSAHDFRADRGDGEHFRTGDYVKNYLTS
ncbi:MAG: FkbM family methyltransferase [Methylophilus sp.]|nr:FkbM family methyltransferase [Methylophilus sp.]